jgi:hypothetical protein
MRQDIENLRSNLYNIADIICKIVAGPSKPAFVDDSTDEIIHATGGYWGEPGDEDAKDVEPEDWRLSATKHLLQTMHDETKADIARVVRQREEQRAPVSQEIIKACPVIESRLSPEAEAKAQEALANPERGNELIAEAEMDAARAERKAQRGAAFREMAVRCGPPPSSIMATSIPPVAHDPIAAADEIAAEDPTPEIVDPIGGVSLPFAIIDILRVRALTNGQLQKKTNRSAKAIADALADLQQSGIVVATGERRAKRYSLAPPKSTAAE